MILLSGINVLRPEIMYNVCLLMLFLFARKTLVLCLYLCMPYLGLLASLR